MLMNQLIHLLTQQLIHPPYAYSFLLMPCFVIAYKAYVIVLQSPQLLTHLCLLFLLIHVLTDQLHCLLISLLIAYSYMLTPLLTDRLQSPYCCLTNPCFFYKSCLLSPHVYKLHWQPCKKKQLSPCFKDVIIPLFCSVWTHQTAYIKSLSLVDL